MPRLSVDPPTRTASAKSTFIQTITAADNGKIIGKAIWTSSPTQASAIQIISIEVDARQLRQGVGSQLMKRLFDEAFKRSKSLDVPLRRIWILIEQKTHIIARGFLGRHGFHHVRTIESLYKGESAMVYVRSFD